MFEQEQEVLLFPYFAFQVRNTTVCDNVTIITLVELPFQDLLQIRELHYQSLIWCDMDKSSFVSTFDNQDIKNKLREVNYVYCSDLEKCHKLIQSTVKAVIIVSGKLGFTLL